MTDLNLSCQCGRVTGIAHQVGEQAGNRIVCYCASCQKFAQQMRIDGITDEFGGTDIYQMPIAHLQIKQGKPHIRCLRITDKGPYRWYASCCGTPIGNTGGPALPFIGLIHSFADKDQPLDTLLGPVQGRVFRRTATGHIPENWPGNKSQRRIVARMLWRLLKWKLTGKARPNPFFENERPIAAPERIE